MINSVLNEGLRGLHTSARELQKSAHEIAQFNVREEDPASGTSAEDQTILPVARSQEAADAGDIAEPVIELKRQELLFTASARVVKVADDTLGSLLDTRS